MILKSGHVSRDAFDLANSNPTVVNILVLYVVLVLIKV